MISNKIYNFIILLFIGVMIVYSNNIPPIVIIRRIPKQDADKEYKNDEMCYSYEYREDL
jgi:hypothetical protein